MIGVKYVGLFLMLFVILSLSPVIAQNNEQVPDTIPPVQYENSDTLRIIDQDTIDQVITPPISPENDQGPIRIVEREFPDPLKATLLSAALPGLGQVYNNSHWKVPIIYGGLLTLGYLVHYFDYNYIKFRNAFLAANDNNPNTINPFEGMRAGQRLFDRVEFYRRNRDYMMILTAGFYLLNIVEAHVDAHLQTFDLSDDISLNISPGIISTPYTSQIGLSLNFTFK